MRIYKLSPVTYKVKLPTNSPIATTIHINRMKPYYDPASRPISPMTPLNPTWMNQGYQMAVLISPVIFN